GRAAAGLAHDGHILPRLHREVHVGQSLDLLAAEAGGVYLLQIADLQDRHSGFLLVFPIDKAIIADAPPPFHRSTLQNGLEPYMCVRFKPILNAVTFRLRRKVLAVLAALRAGHSISFEAGSAPSSSPERVPERSVSFANKSFCPAFYKKRAGPGRSPGGVRGGAPGRATRTSGPPHRWG